MKFLAYCSNGKLSYDDYIVSRCTSEVEYLSEMPTEIDNGDILIVELDTISRELIEKIKYKKMKFVLLIKTYAQENLNLLLNLSGGSWIYKDLIEDEFIPQFRDAIARIKMFDMLHHLSHNDIEMFRYIHRAANGKKLELSNAIFGATGEGTMDVNLSRLRKKLKDPEVGNDFFRVIAREGRLYVVNQISNYEIIKELRTWE